MGGAASGLAAVWPDLWLMAPHPLEESLAAYVLVPAIYLIDLPRASASTRRVAWAGFLLGLAFALRIQLAPAIAVAGLMLCGGDWRRWRAALPAALPVLAFGLLDWLTWGQPFRSFWLNIYINLFLHVATSVFGKDGGGFLPYALAFDWLWTLPFMLFLIWRGAPRLPVPAAVGGAVLLTHLLIAHKEFRFIFPALALLVPVAGVGLAALMTAPARRPGWLYALWLSGAFCSPLSAMLALYQTHSYQLFAGLAAARPCVVSLQGWDKNFLPLPMLFTPRTRFTDATFNADGVEADAIVGSAGSMRVPPGFALQGCVAGNWIPFQHPANPPTCAWIRPITACPAGKVTPFEIVFPAAARRFIIRDRLTDGS